MSMKAWGGGGGELVGGYEADEEGKLVGFRSGQ